MLGTKITTVLPIVPQTEDFKNLVKNVRLERAKTNICPSAQPGINVPDILNTIISREIYKEDYETLTSRILEERVDYETAIEAIKTIAVSNVFEE